MYYKILIIGVLVSIISGCKFIKESHSEKELRLIPITSEIGNYTELTEETEKSFNLELISTSYSAIEQPFGDIDSLVSFNLKFENSSDSAVIVQFPFNWMPRFIEEPVYFLFEDSSKNDCFVESFYDEIDLGLNNSPQLIIIDSKKALTIRGVLYNKDFYLGNQEEKCFGFRVNYYLEGKENLLKEISVFYSSS